MAPLFEFTNQLAAHGLVRPQLTFSAPQTETEKLYILTFCKLNLVNPIGHLDNSDQVQMGSQSVQEK